MSASFVGVAAGVTTDTGGAGTGTWKVTCACPVVADGDLLIYVNGSPRSYDGGVSSHPLLEPVTSHPTGFSLLTTSTNTKEAWGIEIWTKTAVAATDSGATLAFGYADDYNHVHGVLLAYRGLTGVIDQHQVGFGVALAAFSDKCDDLDGAHAHAHFDASTTFGPNADDLYLAIALCNGYGGGETTPSGLTHRAGDSSTLSGHTTGILVYDLIGNGVGYTPSYLSSDTSSSSGATLVVCMLASSSTGVSPKPLQGLDAPWKTPGFGLKTRANTDRIHVDSGNIAPLAIPSSMARSEEPWFAPGMFAQIRSAQAPSSNGLILVNNIGGSPLFKRIQ